MEHLRDLFHELIRFETELWNAVDARLRTDVDLPMTWFEPMRVIADRPSCRVFDIADELSLTVGGTSKLVDRIEAAGHRVRRANPEDRRSSIIELTPTGGQLLASAREAFDDELRTLLAAAVPASALEQFHATLVGLRSANARAGAQAGSRAGARAGSLDGDTRTSA
jgi:DNA-binding MarR family transcriptional regulator